MNFKSFDGKNIFIHEWTDVNNPVGVVQIIHGMTEHGRRYEDLAKYLNENGYVVIADDHRGHGKTDRYSLGYSKGDMFADTVRDEIEITKVFKKKFPGLKYFILGHSYGSFITQEYLGQNSYNIDGAILAGSSYKKDFEVYLGSVVSHLGNEKKPAKLIDKLSFGNYARMFENGNWLNSDPDNMIDENAAFMNFVCSNRFYRDFFKGLRGLYTKTYIKALNKALPILIVSGKDDPVGGMGKGTRKLYDFYVDKAKMENVELVLFEHSRHEFLNEKENRYLKWGTILDFLNENI